MRDAHLLDVERQDRAEAAVEELQTEDDRHQQDEIVERQHAPKRHWSALARLDCRDVRRALVVEKQHDHERRGIERRRYQKRAAQADEMSDHSADHRTDAWAEALRRLDQADRLRHTAWWRRFGGHRDRDRAVAGEQPLRHSQRQHVPRARDICHRGHHHDEAHERPLDHDLAPMPVGEPAPQGR